MQKNTKAILKILGLIFALPLILAVWPFLIGGFISYKAFRTTKLKNKVKVGILVPVILITLFVGSAWVSALVSPTEKTEQVSTNVAVNQPSTNETTTESTPSMAEVKEETNLIENKQEEKLYKVIRVVDGDTIELEGNTKVRYIGIDTPETVNPNTTVECFGQESSNKNKELVEGKMVKLEKDVSETDKYGRLLRYVYIDNVFVNDLLVRQGYANASSYPPDVKYQEQFRQAETEARESNRGLWSSCNKPTTTSTPSPTPVPTAPSTGTPVSPKANTTSYTCNCKKTCAQMASCAEAQYQLNTCGCSARDNDHDGIACDAQCQ